MTIRYEELFGDPLDFAIRRTDDRKHTSHLFVALASKNQCYVEDEKTEEKMILNGESVCRNRHYGDSNTDIDIVFRKFFTSYKRQHLHLLQHTWARNIDDEYFGPNELNQLVTCVIAEPCTKAIMLGWIPSNCYYEISYEMTDLGQIRITPYTLEQFTKHVIPKHPDKHTTKFMIENQNNETMNQFRRMFDNDYTQMYEICSNVQRQFGNDNALQFLSRITKILEHRSFNESQFENISDILSLKRNIPEVSVQTSDSPYMFDSDIRRESTGSLISFDSERLLDYIEKEPICQGIESHNFLPSWLDVLSMQLMLTGHINDKYPRNLKTYERILIREMDTIRKQMDKKHKALEEQRWARNVGNRLDKYEFKTDEWLTVVPRSPQDMAREAANQHNCLASYINTVMDPEDNTDIIFMRKAQNPDKSWITIEYKNGKVKQAFETCNKSLGEFGTKYLNEWQKMLKKKESKA